jgi:hypothetical protein
MKNKAIPTVVSASIAFASMFCLVTTAGAQQLPAPSRTVFKCNAGGKIVYSDSPCLGAERIDVDPTRGMNSMSGKKAIDSDVRTEQQREQIAEAWRPLTGMDAKQFEAHGRRTKLPQDAQRECSTLDKALPMTEKEEGQTVGAARATAQERLYGLRKRFRKLRC